MEWWVSILSGMFGGVVGLGIVGFVCLVIQEAREAKRARRRERAWLRR